MYGGHFRTESNSSVAEAKRTSPHSPFIALLTTLKKPST